MRSLRLGGVKRMNPHDHNSEIPTFKQCLFTRGMKLKTSDFDLPSPSEAGEIFLFRFRLSPCPSLPLRNDRDSHSQNINFGIYLWPSWNGIDHLWEPGRQVSTFRIRIQRKHRSRPVSSLLSYKIFLKILHLFEILSLNYFFKNHTEKLIRKRILCKCRIFRGTMGNSLWECCFTKIVSAIEC